MLHHINNGIICGYDFITKLVTRNEQLYFISGRSKCSYKKVSILCSKKTLKFSKLYVKWKPLRATFRNNGIR